MNFKFFLFLLALLSFSFSAVLQVNKTAGGCGQTLAANYTTISSAITAATAGDTIYVCGGNVAYNETVTVNKGLNIYGNQSGVIITAADATTATVTISASNVNLTNFTIDGASSAAAGPAAVDIGAVTFIKLYNLTLNHSYIGIKATSAENLSIHNNTIKYVSDPGISFTGTRFSNITYNLVYNATVGSGISLGTNSNFNNISNNKVTFTIAGSGIVVSGSSSNNISYNTVNGTAVYGYGLASTSENNTFTYNIAESNQDIGFNVDSSNNNTLLYNNATNNTNRGFRVGSSSNYNNFSYNNASKNGQIGFSVDNNDDNSFSYNSAFNNSIYGFHLSDSSDTNLSYNNASKTLQHGFYADGDSNNNNFTLNRAFDNTLGGFVSVTSAAGNEYYANFAYNNSAYGFAFSTDNGSTLELNNASNNPAQYHFQGDSNTTFKGINRALNTPQTGLDLNVSGGSNASGLVGDDFYNFTTSYGTFFFGTAENVSIKLMNLSDSGATISGCSGFAGSCTLITIGTNVINITNISAAARLDLGMFYDVSNAAGVSEADIYISKYNLSDSGWRQVGQTMIDDSLGFIRYDSLTTFSTFGVVKYLIPSAASSESSGQIQLELSYSFICKDALLEVSTEIENANVIVIQTSPDLFKVDEKLTDSSGDAYFTILQDGTYRIRATKSGYYAAQLNNIELSLCKVEPLKVQCNTNNDCDLDKFCSNGQCIEVKGTCGYADKHEWVKYECCSDSECNEGYLCTLNKCILGTTILEDPEMLKAQEKLDQVSEEINRARKEGSDVSAAEKKLNEAQEAFNNEDYDLSEQLAGEAMQLIKKQTINMVDEPKNEVERPLTKAPDNNMIFLFALGTIGLVVIAVILLFYFLSRKKK